MLPPIEGKHRIAMRFLFFVVSSIHPSIHPSGNKGKKIWGGGWVELSQPGDVGAMRCGCGSVPGARMSESDLGGWLGKGEGEGKKGTGGGMNENGSIKREVEFLATTVVVPSLGARIFLSPLS